MTDKTLYTKYCSSSNTFGQRILFNWDYCIFILYF